MSTRKIRAHRRARQQRTLASRLLLGGGLLLIALAGALIVGPGILGGGDRVALASNNVLGSPSAPVEVVVWSDFQCPGCRQYAVGPGHMLTETAVAEERARVRYRHLAFLGEESTYAAEAAECSAQQGRFWEYHDRLFAEQRGRNQGTFSKGNLKQLGAEIGLDTTAFNTCVDTGTMAARVKAELEEGRQLGVTRTPTLFVNGRKIEGVPSFEDLLRTVQAALVPVPSARG